MHKKEQKCLKVVSINIELNKHLDEVCAFLRAERPDIVGLEEVVKSDMPRLSDAIGMAGRFEPMTISNFPRHKDLGINGIPIGLALFSRFKAEFSADYYVGAPDKLPFMFDPSEPINRMLLTASFAVEGRRITAGVTHFTWTKDGEANDIQRNDMKKFLNEVSKFPEIIFFGDFNAPRGKEMWGEMASRYKDNIPEFYDSSLDPEKHRLKDSKKLVVDGLFSTANFDFKEVRFVGGLSDHKAIVGILEV